MKINLLLLAMLSLAALAAVSSAYVTQIHAIAVLQGEDKGMITPAYLNLTAGNGAIKFVGNTTVNQSTLQSAQTAVGYATSYLGVNALNYNFTYTLDTNGSSASGPSGGLAFTLLAIAALQHKQLAQNFAVTGTISSNGAVGLIGGAYDKIGAAKADGIRYVMVPSASNSSFEGLLYYMSQQTFGIPVFGIGNVTQALPYAFGTSVPGQIGIGIYQNYGVGAMPYANVTCRGCNTSSFLTLVNATQAFSKGYAENITGNFSAAKSQLLNNLGEYGAIEGKGYLYTAADFAFLDFVKAFTLYNAHNLNPAAAGSVVSNVSSYCSSLVPAPMTNADYEYVLGGNLRSMWANTTLNLSNELLSSQETTDDLFQSVYDAGQALGWCKAASLQYQIAYSLGGTYVAVSPSLKPYVTGLMNSVSGYGPNIYLTSAVQAYSSGDYATALYALEYEKAFGQQVPANLTDSQIVSFVSSSASNSTFGVWPTEFSAQSEFYLNEANAAQNESARRGYLDQAYSTALLASGLSSANIKLSSSLIASNVTSQGQMGQQLLMIQQSISQIYVVLLLVLVLMFVMFVAILVLALRRPAESKPVSRPAAARRRRARR